MQENRNSCGCGQGQDNRGMMYIDTTRILDACRDRDCFENERVYLTASGEEILSAASNVRAKSARILWAYVGVNEAAFNTGFYQISIRYYIETTFEACVGVGRSQTFIGITTLEKEVMLYGGEGSITTYSSTPGGSFCEACTPGTVSTNLPIAVVDTVEPIILGTRVVDRNCCCSCEALDLPDQIRNCVSEPIVDAINGLEIRISLGIFSVIRIERPAQIMIQGSDYSVPEKECAPTQACADPCDLFRGIAFPYSRFKPSSIQPHEPPTRGGGCGCGK